MGISGTQTVYGREALSREIAEVEDPLLTLVGTGGIGKSTLARLVAPHGNVWVDLAGTSAATLRPLVARAAGKANFATALEALAVAPRLVVLDNCEHLLGDLDTVVSEILETGSRVWATSRAPLGVPGERIVPVTPLDRATAVDLLLHRLTSLRFGWTPTREEQERLVPLADRMGGIPLAMELLAAAAASRTLEETEAALANFVSRRHVTRHASMHDVAHLSLSLLPTEARDAFARLATYQTPFIPEDAAALDVGRSALDALVEASLLVADFSGSVPRYRWLEPLREVAAALLEKEPHAARTHRCHAERMIGLVEAKGPRLGTMSTPEDIDRMEERWADHLAALETLIADGDERAANLLEGLYMAFFLRQGRGRSKPSSNESSTRARPPHRRSLGLLAKT